MMKPLKKGLERTTRVGNWHGLALARSVKSPKEKDRGLDLLEFAFSQGKVDAGGDTLPKGELWRVHFVQCSPYAATIRFARRRPDRQKRAKRR